MLNDARLRSWEQVREFLKPPSPMAGLAISVSIRCTKLDKKGQVRKQYLSKNVQTPLENLTALCAQH